VAELLNPIKIFISAQVKKPQFILVLFLLGLCLVLTVCFSIVNLPGGDDWQTFYGAAQRVLHNQPLYGTKITFSYFYYPPWLAVLLIPLALFPFRIGWSALSAITIISIFMLARRWKLSALKLVMVLLSPPTIYSLLHGDVDALVLGLVFLPHEFWILAAVTKPQTLIALAAGAIRSNWKKTTLITCTGLALSLLFFGNWISADLKQSTDVLGGGHNFMALVFPFSIVVGLVMVYLGWKKDDETYLVGASPMFSPYGATSTLLGPFMFLASKLKEWQLLLIFLAWWGWAVFKP
jgi:hypothetical protein